MAQASVAFVGPVGNSLQQAQLRWSRMHVAPPPANVAREIGAAGDATTMPACSAIAIGAVVGLVSVAIRGGPNLSGSRTAMKSLGKDVRSVQKNLETEVETANMEDGSAPTTAESVHTTASQLFSAAAAISGSAQADTVREVTVDFKVEAVDDAVEEYSVTDVFAAGDLVKSKTDGRVGTVVSVDVAGDPSILYKDVVLVYNEAEQCFAKHFEVIPSSEAQSPFQEVADQFGHISKQLSKIDGTKAVAGAFFVGDRVKSKTDGRFGTITYNDVAGFRVLYDKGVLLYDRGVECHDADFETATDAEARNPLTEITDQFEHVSKQLSRIGAYRSTSGFSVGDRVMAKTDGRLGTVTDADDEGGLRVMADGNVLLYDIGAHCRASEFVIVEPFEMSAEAKQNPLAQVLDQFKHVSKQFSKLGTTRDIENAVFSVGDRVRSRTDGRVGLVVAVDIEGDPRVLYDGHDRFYHEAHQTYAKDFEAIDNTDKDFSMALSTPEQRRGDLTSQLHHVAKQVSKVSQ